MRLFNLFKRRSKHVVDISLDDFVNIHNMMLLHRVLDGWISAKDGKIFFFTDEPDNGKGAYITWRQVNYAIKELEYELNIEP